MNIAEEVKKGIYHFSVVPCDCNVAYTQHSLETLMNNQIFRDSVIQQIPDNVKTLDDYLFFLVINRINGLLNCSNLPHDVSKERDIKEKLSQINLKKLASQSLNYINKNFLQIWNLNNRDIRKATLSIIKQKQKKKKDKVSEPVIETLIEVDRYYLIYNFQEFRPSFKKYKRLLPKVLDVRFFLKSEPVCLNEIIDLYLKIMSNNNSDNAQFKEIVEENINVLLDKIEELYKEKIDYKQALSWYDNLQKFKTILTYTDVNKDKVEMVERLIKKLDIVKAKGLKENGQQIVYKEKINFKKIVNGLKKDGSLICLTHKISDNKFMSFLEEISPKQELSDFIKNIGVQTDENYPASYQDKLNIQVTFLGAIFQKLITESESSNIFSQCFLRATQKISYELEYNQILNHAQMLMSNLLIISNNSKLLNDKNQMLIQTMSYNAISLSIGLTEELLREYAIHLGKKSDISRGDLTLGKLLSIAPSNDYFYNISKQHKLALGYFLVKAEGENITKNIRNQVAHLCIETENLFTLENVGKILYLLTDVLNTITIACI